MKTERSTGNGSQIRTATPTATAFGRASSTSEQAQTKLATKSGRAIQKTNIWKFLGSRMLN